MQKAGMTALLQTVLVKDVQRGGLIKKMVYVLRNT
jgi:hypothetical protein